MSFRLRISEWTVNVVTSGSDQGATMVAVALNSGFAHCGSLLVRSYEVGDFCGTGIEIWAGFGLNGRLSCLHSFKIF